MTSKTAARLHFSTDDLPAENRLAIWREVAGRHYMKLDIEPYDANAISASVDVQPLPGVEIISLQADPARYTRTRALANDGNGDFSFNWNKQSGYRMLTDNDDENVAEGDGVLLFHGAPGTFHVESRVRINSVRVDGALIRSRLRGIDERLFHRALAGSDGLRLLTAYVDALISGGVPSDPVLACRVSEHVADLIAAAVQPSQDSHARAVAGAVPAARFAVATADILAHLSDPRLSAKQVAQRAGLSERSIYLLFERHGLAFAAFVTEQRLKLAYAMLCDPARRALRIVDIAFAAGFADLTTFNRSFRRRYGRTPSSLRRHAAG